MGTERIQLNLRLDGRPELLDAIKSAAAAKNLSVNAFMLSVMESAVGMESSTASAAISKDLESVIASVLDRLLESTLDAKLDPKLDTLLDAKLAERRTKPMGKQAAWVRAKMNRSGRKCRQKMRGCGHL